MPTTLDFLKAKVMAVKHTLDSRSSKEKGGHISVQTAQQFNAVIEEIKKASPEAAPHLPQPIQWGGHMARLASQANVTFLDLEIMVNQVLGILDVLGRPPA
jgi:hypothetical protein